MKSGTPYFAPSSGKLFQKKKLLKGKGFKCFKKYQKTFKTVRPHPITSSNPSQSSYTLRILINILSVLYLSYMIPNHQSHITL